MQRRLILTPRRGILAMLILLSITLWAQKPYHTQAHKSNVKALQVHRTGWALSYPIIYLNNASETIQMSFDILDANTHQVSYTIVHCNADWRPSDLSANEYLDGFESNYIEDYDYSQAANIDYIHYRLQVPNAATRLLVSGNYAICFTDDDSGDTLATACFSIVDQQVDISGSVGGIAMAGPSDQMQQVNLNIDHSHYSIEQPITETQVVVRQNNSSLRQARLTTPSYIYDGRLVYDNLPALAFPGGDEYRYFDCASLRFAGHGIVDIQFFDPFYHINLRPNTCQHHLSYKYDDDINGKFLIRRQESDEADGDVEADYAVAHFSLAMEDPILDGKVYLSGAFTYDQLNSAHQMIYQAKRKRYEADILLKQGYYNYRYYVRDNRTGQLRSAPIERDAYAAENDYLIFFYHRPFGERYDQLIGYQVINSLK